MKKDNDLVSIIVPCFNVERYIKKCLDSLINQTYKNIEIIVVDDGSEDGTSSIIQQYAKTDERIIVKRQKNAGLSAARNTGLRAFKGKYVCFVDSDDYVAFDYIEKMYACLIKNNCDICACNYSYIYEDGSAKERPFTSEKVMNSSDALFDLFSGKQETSIVAWNKLYKAELFKKNSIVFPVGKINEDNYTTYKLYYYAKKVCYVAKPLYYYLQRRDSIMGTAFNSNRMHILDAYDETVRFFMEHKTKEDLREVLTCYQAFILVNLYNTIVRGDYSGKEKRIVRDSILCNKKRFYRNKILAPKIKMMVFLISDASFIHKVLVQRMGGR